MTFETGDRIKFNWHFANLYGERSFCVRRRYGYKDWVIVCDFGETAWLVRLDRDHIIAADHCFEPVHPLEQLAEASK